MAFHDDDLMRPLCVKTLSEALDSNPKASSASSNALLLEEKKTDALFNPFLNSDLVINSSSDLINRYITPKLSHTPFPSYMYRAALTDGLQLDSRDGGKHADASFLVNLIERGPFVWLAEPLMVYRKHSENDSVKIDLGNLARLLLFFFKKKPSAFGKLLVSFNKNAVKAILNKLK